MPGWGAGMQEPSELQDGHRHTQHAGKEGDQDQPEGPPPASQHAHGLQPDERDQREQEGGGCPLASRVGT
jgi:hypothetical protein